MSAEMVNKLFILLLLINLFVQISCSQQKPGKWLDNGNPIADGPDHKAVNGFGVHVILVEDPKAFMEIWRKPEFPDIKTVKVARGGVPIAAFVLFAGCTPGSNGTCDTSVDYIVINPKGNVIGEKKDQILWSEAPPPKENTQAGKASLTFTFNDGNPTGEYTVRAVAKDRNADISLEVETKVEFR
jgi:hypothetical protein